MSEQTTGAFDPGQVPAPASGEAIGDGGAGQDAPQYATRADLEALFERMERRLQSVSDKQENRLKREFDKRLAERQQAYAAMGISMPESEKTAIAQAVLNSTSVDGPRPGQAEPSQTPPEVAAVNRMKDNILAKAGVAFEDITSEELRSLRTTGDPEDYLDDVRRVAAAAAERKRGQAQRPLSQAAAPMMGGGTASGDRLTEITQRMQELQRSPGKNRDELRKLGKEQESLLRSMR